MPKYNSDNYSGNYVSDEFLQSLTGDEKAYPDFYSPQYYIWEKQSFGFPFDQSPVSYGIEGSKPCEEDYHRYRYDLTKEAAAAMAEYIPEKIYPIGKKTADNS